MQYSQKPLSVACDCTEGWTGLDCATKVCPDGCSGHGSCVYGTCQCEALWAGSACSVKQCAIDCGSHGICQAGECLCLDGWTGAECSVQQCPSGCSGNGVCRPVAASNNVSATFECECHAGWNGTACAIKSCENGCSGHGYCWKMEGEGNRECVCDDGWGGDDCGEEACVPACASDHAICRGGVCLCEEGWGGLVCDEQLCLGGCDHGACAVGGKCICDSGWAGPHCTQSTCSGHGRWAGSTQGCDCKKPFFGVFCEQTQSCASLGDCSGHGICDNGQCFCQTGFTGLTCKVPISSSNQAKKAKTKASDNSFRFASRDAVTTTTVDCKNDCSFAGLCRNGKCICLAGRTGEACENRQTL